MSTHPDLSHLPADLVERARDVELLVLDVDGVLTDGRLWYGAEGELMKAMHTRDGHGIVMLRHAGVPTAILSGRPQQLLARRFAELRVVHVEERSFLKGEAIEQIAEKLGVGLARMCYVGDDVNDVPAMERAGLSFAPADAVPEAKAAADRVCDRYGGRGVVREVAELLLKARNAWPAP